MSASPRRTTAVAINMMKEQVLLDLELLREALPPELTHEQAEALASLETFIAIAIRVYAGTNPSKMRDAMRLVEIQARMDGKEGFE